MNFFTLATFNLFLYIAVFGILIMLVSKAILFFQKYVLALVIILVALITFFYLIQTQFWYSTHENIRNFVTTITANIKLSDYAEVTPSQGSAEITDILNSMSRQNSAVTPPQVVEPSLPPVEQDNAPTGQGNGQKEIALLIAQILAPNQNHAVCDAVLFNYPSREFEHPINLQNTWSELEDASRDRTANTESFKAFFRDIYQGNVDAGITQQQINGCNYKLGNVYTYRSGSKEGSYKMVGTWHLVN
jgi:hypothetical protein